MEILKWGILALLVLPVPFLLGMIPIKYMSKSQKTPAMTYACGWFLSFAVFEVVAIPFILLEKSFTSLVITYTAVVAALLVYSVIGLKNIFPTVKDRLKDIKAMPVLVKACWAAAFLIIGAQMIYAVLFEYYDGDDAYYIATAVLTDSFDTMYLRDAYTGYVYSLDVRHAFSPTPIYQAWLSRLSGIGPAAVAHSMLAPVWLLLMYCIYGQIGNRLLTKERKVYRPMFLIFISIWLAFGNISLYTAETFAMTRTWQGKGLMAGIILPALLLCFLNIVADNASKGSWILFICVILSAVFATSISFMLIPTMVGLAAILIGIKKQSIKTAILMLICCIPCVLLGGCYMIMR